MISSTGAVTKTGTGNVQLDGENTYTGLTTITAGTLTIGVVDALANTTDVTFAAAGTLVVDATDTVGSIAGAGSITLSSGQTLSAGGSKYRY